MPVRRPVAAAIYGIDLGKTRFDVIASHIAGKPIQRVKLGRDMILRFFEASPSPALIGMEACPGAQWLARKLAVMGHTVRIIPAQFVKPFVKSNKNDARDAEAIAEAVVRPTMRFVEIKTEAQVDLQALHRVRDRIVSNRPSLSAKCAHSASNMALRCDRTRASSRSISRESSPTKAMT